MCEIFRIFNPYFRIFTRPFRAARSDGHSYFRFLALYEEHQELLHHCTY